MEATRAESARAQSPSAKSPSAPTQWFLLRGLGRERRHWFDFGALLETTLDAHCAYLDLPGVGRRRTETAPASMPELARSVACGWEETLQGRRPVGIVALSLGAMVAMELAFEYPQAISHLVLINSSSSLSPPWARFNPRAACELTGAALTRDALSMEQLLYRWTLHRKRAEAGRYARMACDIRRDSPVSSRTVAAQLKAASHFLPPHVSQRTLIVSSGQDRLVSPRCSRDLASFLGAPSKEHAEAGHDLPLDDPAWLLEQIANWVEGETPARKPPRQS